MTVDGVGVTSVAVAAARALESIRPDSLVDDPWASALVEASGVATPLPDRWPEGRGSASAWDQSLLLGASYIGLRTRFVDDELLAVRLRQVVFLGSGLDTRAWRLAWPVDATLFALDSPEVTALIESVLEAVGATPRCRRIPIAADVTKPWASLIISNGFDPRTPTHWIIEGLLPYLSAHDQSALLDDVMHLSASGSAAVIERAAAIQNTPEALARLAELARATGMPMDEVLSRADPPDPARVLGDAGWTTNAVSVADLESRYRRPLQPAPTSSTSGRGGFVVARRR